MCRLQVVAALQPGSTKLNQANAPGQRPIYLVKKNIVGLKVTDDYVAVVLRCISYPQAG